MGPEKKALKREGMQPLWCLVGRPSDTVSPFVLLRTSGAFNVFLEVPFSDMARSN